MNVLIIAAKERRQRYVFLAQPLQFAGHSVQVLETRPIGGFVVAFISALRFGRQPDLMVLMGAGPKDWFASIFAKRCGICTVARLGGDYIRDQESAAASSWRSGRYADWLRGRVNVWFAKRVLRQVAAVIVVNPGLARRLNARFPGLLRMFVVPQFCAGTSVAHDYALRQPVELLSVTNLRFFEKAQGIIWLIGQVNAFVHASGLAVRYRVAGSGVHLRDIQDHLSTMSLHPALEIRLEGYQDDLNELYLGADILLYHSTHDATPNVILESKKYGLPLLANDCVEFRAIVRNGVDGLLYTDAAEFQQNLQSLLGSTEQRAALGIEALAEHACCYSVAAVAERLEQTVVAFARVCGSHD